MPSDSSDLIKAPQRIPPHRHPPQDNGNRDTAQHAHPSDDFSSLLECLIHLRFGKLALMRVVVSMTIIIGAEYAAVSLPIDEDK